MSFAAPLMLLARLLLAAMFVLRGVSKFGNLAGTAGYIASKGLPLPMLLAIGTAALELVAGLALIVGYRTRLAALALGLFTLLASLLFHAFWAMPPEQQGMQQLMFMKNMAVAGGMFLLSAVGAGALSLDSRRTKAA